MTEEEKIICKQFLNDADKTHSCNEYKMLMALLEQEQTAKNDLGVDCISRQIISDYVENHIQEINTGYGDLNRRTNSILRMIVNYVENMPSVTPQEPKIKVLDFDEVARKLGAVDIYKANAWITLLKDLEYLGMKICEVEE